MIATDPPMERNHLKDNPQQIQNEDASQPRISILEGISAIAEELVKDRNWEEHSLEVLGIIGKICSASRVNLLRLHTGSRGDWLASQTVEWAAPGIQPQADNPGFQGMPLEDAPFNAAAGLLAGNKILEYHLGQAQAAPQAAACLLPVEYSLRSALLAPVFSAEKWVGVIGVEDYQADREWSGAEIEGLRITARLIGAAIQRSEMEGQLSQVLSTERRQKLLEDSLSATGAALASSLNLDEVLDRILSECNKVVPNVSSSIMLVENGIARLVRAQGEWENVKAKSDRSHVVL